MAFTSLGVCEVLSNEAGGWVISCENSSISQSNFGVSVATGAADGRGSAGGFLHFWHPLRRLPRPAAANHTFSKLLFCQKLTFKLETDFFVSFKGSGTSAVPGFLIFCTSEGTACHLARFGVA